MRSIRRRPIKPSDPGWKDFVKGEIDKSGLKFTPECSVTLEVRATGKTEERPLDGANPDDFDKELGWKEDRVYKTTPPEPYQDFTRWVRRYPYMRTQKCVEYKAQVYVRCGAHFVARAPKRFFVAEGAPKTVGPVEIYNWTKTSGLEKDKNGKVFEWEKTGKKSPPLTWGPEPYPQDIAHPQTTPPHDMINPPSWGLDLKLELGGSYKDWWPVEPKMPFKDWCKIEDLFKKDK